jgi:hypothetical protein
MASSTEELSHLLHFRVRKPKFAHFLIESDCSVIPATHRREEVDRW